MAPKKKMGSTRMNSAMNHITKLGFPKQLIRKTLNNLLKVYGYDGWTLIEEDGYKVVLDVILEEQRTPETQNLLMDASSQHETPGNELVTTDSTEVSNENDNISSLTNNAELNEAPCLQIKDWKDFFEDESALHSIAFHTGDDHSKGPSFLKHSCDASHTPQNVPTRKRKPCYGWISDDDDEEETYLITLPPST